MSAAPLAALSGVVDRPRISVHYGLVLTGHTHLRRLSGPMRTHPWHPDRCTSLCAGWAVLASVLGLGCYRDVPTALDQVPPGSSVRAQIVVHGTMRSPSGPRPDPSTGRESLTIQGTLVERDRDRVVFQVPALRTAAQLAYDPVHQRISVARQDVLHIALRRLDAKRTGGIVALIAGATVVAILTASTEVGGSVSQPPPSGDVSVRGVLRWSCCR